MKKEHGKIEGDVLLHEDLEIHGTITGNVEVEPHTKLFHYGMIIKNLIVNEKAEAFVHGTVSGDLMNRGGKVEIYGTIHGRVIEESGNTFIDPKAKTLNKS